MANFCTRSLLILLATTQYFTIIYGQVEGTIKNPITCGNSVIGSISSEFDAETYPFTVSGSSSLSITFSTCDTVTSFDTELKLYNSSKQRIGEMCDIYALHSPIGSCNDCDGINLELETWDMMLVPGDYYIEVHGYDTEVGTYTLDMICNITTPTPTVPHEFLWYQQGSTLNKQNWSTILQFDSASFQLQNDHNCPSIQPCWRLCAQPGSNDFAAYIYRIDATIGYENIKFVFDIDLMDMVENPGACTMYYTLSDRDNGWTQIAQYTGLDSQVDVELILPNSTWNQSDVGIKILTEGIRPTSCCLVSQMYLLGTPITMQPTTATPTTLSPTNLPTTSSPTTVFPTTTNPTAPTTKQPTIKINSPTSAPSNPDEGRNDGISTTETLQTNDNLSVTDNETDLLVIYVVVSFVILCIGVVVFVYWKHRKNKVVSVHVKEISHGEIELGMTERVNSMSENSDMDVIRTTGESNGNVSIDAITKSDDIMSDEGDNDEDIYTEPTKGNNFVPTTKGLDNEENDEDMYNDADNKNKYKFEQTTIGLNDKENDEDDEMYEAPNEEHRKETIGQTLGIDTPKTEK